MSRVSSFRFMMAEKHIHISACETNHDAQKKKIGLVGSVARRLGLPTIRVDALHALGCPVHGLPAILLKVGMLPAAFSARYTKAFEKAEEYAIDNIVEPAVKLLVGNLDYVRHLPDAIRITFLHDAADICFDISGWAAVSYYVIYISRKYAIPGFKSGYKWYQKKRNSSQIVPVTSIDSVVEKETTFS